MFQQDDIGKRNFETGIFDNKNHWSRFTIPTNQSIYASAEERIAFNEKWQSIVDAFNANSSTGVN